MSLKELPPPQRSLVPLIGTQEIAGKDVFRIAHIVMVWQECQGANREYVTMMAYAR